MLKKDAVFDEQKLEWLNGEHIRQKPLEDLVPEALAAWTDEGWLEAGKAEDGTLSRLVALVQERVRTVRDFRAFGYFFRDPEQYEEKARKKHWQADTPARIETLTTRLESLDFFTESKVEEVTRTLAGELGVSTGKLIHPTRLAVSGVGFGPGLFELMEVLGQETCSRRLRKALESL
jgi:glutamyl-tRNA synthetase